MMRSPFAIRMIKRALNAELDGQHGLMEFAVEFGIERAFNHADSEGAAHHNGLAPVYNLVFELFERHYLVDHTHLEGFGSSILAT